MAHYVPPMEWSERALKAREFIFDFWAEQGRGPNLRQAHEGTGMSRRDLVQAYKELQTGIVTALVGAPVFIGIVRRRKLAQL